MELMGVPGKGRKGRLKRRRMDSMERDLTNREGVIGRRCSISGCLEANKPKQRPHIKMENDADDESEPDACTDAQNTCTH